MRTLAEIVGRNSCENNCRKNTIVPKWTSVTCPRAEGLLGCHTGDKKQSIIEHWGEWDDC